MIYIEPKIMDLRINNMKTECSLGYLQIIGENQKIEICGTRIFIGRLATNDIQLTHRSISRRHCLIEVIDKYVYIVDLDSKFGTYLNDIKLSARDRNLLRNNDEIVIGIGIETVKIIYIN